MANQRILVVDAESDGQRLDRFLATNLLDLSRSYLRRLIDEHRVMVDGHSAKAAHRVRAGQRVGVHQPQPAPAVPQPQRIPLSVVYEDADLLVLDKPAGLVVHPASGNPDGTLVNALLNHCDDLSGVGGVVRPGIVHRLDRNTSGLMVVTKHDRAHRHLAEQFKQQRVHKVYLAFAAQRPGATELPGRGTFDTLYGRHPVHRKRFSSRVERGKRAVTRFELLERFAVGKWSVVKLRLTLETGRTHQIRVHLTDAGHPLLGDKLYAGRSLRGFPRELVPERQALHAWKLAFDHPGTGDRLALEAPLADDLLGLENRLRKVAG